MEISRKPLEILRAGMRAQRGFEARMIRLERGVRRKKWRRRSGERGFRDRFGGTRVEADDLVQLDSRVMIRSEFQSSKQNEWGGATYRQSGIRLCAYRSLDQSRRS